jgi:HK97 family phage major capsid protein
MPTIAENAKELTTLLAVDKEFWIKQGEESLSAEQKTEVEGRGKRIEELSAALEESKQYQAARKRNEEINAALNATSDRPSFGDGTNNSNGNNGDDPHKGGQKSLGYRFTESREYKDWIREIAPSGYPADGIRIGSSPAYDAKDLITGSSVTSAGAMVRRDYAPLVDFPFQPLTVRDIVTNGRTGSDLIEFPRVTGYTSNAAPVAEATSTPTSFQQAGNGLKPRSSMTLEKVTTSVKTIAHWIAMTRRALSDAPQIQTLVDNFLNVGLELELEEQMIKGNGSGENFLGLDNTPNITIQPFDTNILTTTRKGLTKARVVGRAQRITGFILNPYDWETLDLTQDNENRYYFGGPMVLGQKRLWGQIVVESEAVFQGTGYTGDTKQAVLWDREQATIRMSDGVEDYFVRNLVAILAELRAAFGVFRPPAIVRMDLAAGDNS